MRLKRICLLERFLLYFCFNHSLEGSAFIVVLKNEINQFLKEYWIIPARDYSYLFGADHFLFQSTSFCILGENNGGETNRL